jgi:hypothetical protein
VVGNDSNHPSAPVSERGFFLSVAATPPLEEGNNSMLEVLICLGNSPVTPAPVYSFSFLPSTLRFYSTR